MARVDSADFVRTWQASDSTEQAAELLGLTIMAAQCRAARYRRLGVPLKKFPRRRGRGPGRKPLDVAALSDIARKAS